MIIEPQINFTPTLKGCNDYRSEMIIESQINFIPTLKGCNDYKGDISKSHFNHTIQTDIFPHAVFQTFLVIPNILL